MLIFRLIYLDLYIHIYIYTFDIYTYIFYILCTYIYIYYIIKLYYIIVVGNEFQKRKNNVCEVTALKCAHPLGTEYSRTC